MLTPEQCEAIRRRSDCEWLARHHAERAGFGGRSAEFHARAETYVRNVPTDIAALLATVEALRSELADVIAVRDAMQALATQSGRELAEAVRVLSEVEWVWRDWGGGESRECPDCCANEYNSKGKHEDGCELSAFLARHGGV